MSAHREEHSRAALGVVLLLTAMIPQAHADGMCTPREPTAAETKAYADAYALFLRVAPATPDGWRATENPETGAMPRLCKEFGTEPMRRRFERSFHLERGLTERENKALQAHADLMKDQRARAAANQAENDAIDVKVNAIVVKTQAAAAAQRFAEVDALNREMDELLKQKTALMGIDEGTARAAQIEADRVRDTEAAFSLWFEAPASDPRPGKPYPVDAGNALLTAYDASGNPQHDVRVYFGGTPQQARVMMVGDPARVRQLLDATDLEAIAGFR
jgi:hypothetical protein